MDETVVRAPEVAPGAVRLANAPKCQDTTLAGTPCKAPAMVGSPWCGNHRGLHDPDYVRPVKHKRTIRELAIRERAAELRDEREAAEKQALRDKHGKRTRTPIIERLAERLEHNPGLVIDVILDGLRATNTVRRRKLNPDGTQAAIAHVWEDDESGLTKVELSPVFEDVTVADHKVRLEYLREVHDRMYGRPAQLKHVEGQIEHTGQINVATMLQAAKALEANPEAYYSSVPDTDPPIDVGSGEVVVSAPPV